MKGFTLVELVIVIAIVIVLSVISVPIYRGYVEKAKTAEGYALMGTVLSAQKAYYSEYGNFYLRPSSWSDFTVYDPVLGIDIRGNRYFTVFTPSGSNSDPKTVFWAHAKIPADAAINGKTWMRMGYNITSGYSVLNQADCIEVGK